MITDYALSVIGYALCVVAGFVAGALAMLRAFLIMHHNTLPPDRRPKSKWRSS